MTRHIHILILLGIVLACSGPMEEKHSLQSPSGKISLEFWLDDSGSPIYSLNYGEETVVLPSHLGFKLEGQDHLEKAFIIMLAETDSMNETWEQPWGEQKTIVNRYHQLKVYLREKSAPFRRMNLIFRAYEDGMAFRYELPEQDSIQEVLITEENTEFRLNGNHETWWIPGDWDIYEHLYTESKLTEIDALAYRDHPNLAQTHIPVNAVSTPITMRTQSGLHLAFHEANLTDYSDMTLAVDSNFTLKSNLVGSENTSYKVSRSLPFSTPWRTVSISPDAVGLINSNLILNLNEPNILGDVDYVEPMKYVGIWWEMHLGISTWDMRSGRHGATTENAKRYIDFAAENGLGGVLVEGWNTGWENWMGDESREGIFDFITPYSDYDLREVVRYAKEKGVEIIMHHETSAATETYEKQMEAAFALMNELDLHMVKTGYVGQILPKGEYHHGQYMVRHYRKVLETAAKYKVAVNAHEPIKDTGIRRTYPNAISREGLRGQEFNAWSKDGGNPPNHLPIVAFTRMLAGPIDFTPGAFNLKLEPYKEENQINTTLAHQLALYVVLYSPVQMACDLPESYVDQAAFQFIRDVGVDWEQSIALQGEVSEYVAIARQDRKTKKWFLGAITNENDRELNIKANFLEAGKRYEATVYADGTEAHWNSNPYLIDIKTLEITSEDTLKIKLAPGGGAAISFIEL